MNRRTFNGLCTSLLAGASTLSQETAANLVNWPESLLMDNHGVPITYDTLAIGSSHIFAYPYQTTPCFLIRLAPVSKNQVLTSTGQNSSESTELTDRNGNIYQWKGGTGKDKTLVAFSAICAHKMTHPAKSVSHLNFQSEEREFVDAEGSKKKQTQLITCCSEYSIYDPARGAKVMGGPATQPLAAIALRIDEHSGHIYATGSYGGNMYNEFITKFGFRLAMENNVTDPRTLVNSTTEITPAADYSAQQIRC